MTDVIKQCKLKASTRSICERQEFWQWWLNERYKLNLNDDKLDYEIWQQNPIIFLGEWRKVILS